MSIFKNGIGDYNEHEIVHDVELGGGAKLHRYTNQFGDEISAIYIGDEEKWWHYRSEEERMIKAWNDMDAEEVKKAMLLRDLMQRNEMRKIREVPNA